MKRAFLLRLSLFCCCVGIGMADIVGSLLPTQQSLEPSQATDRGGLSAYAIVNGGFGSGGRGKDGGPDFTGSMVCVKNGGIMTGADGGTPIRFFCCQSDAQCQSYNTGYSNGLGASTCSAKDADLYCPIGEGGTGNNEYVVKKGASLFTASLYENIDYTVVVYNNGNTTGTNIAISDTPAAGFQFVGLLSVLPSNSNVTGSNSGINWTIPSLAPGVVAILNYRANFASAGTKTNSAVASLCNGSNCSAVRNVAIVSPVLVVSKTLYVQGAPYTGVITNGLTGSYVVTLTNNGFGTATNFSIVDTLPLEFGYSSASSSLGGILYSGGPHNIVRDNFSIGAGVSVTLTINGSRSVVSSGIVTNFATMNHPGYCSIPGANCNAQVSSLMQPAQTGLCNATVMTGYYSGLNALPSTGQLCSGGTLTGLIIGNTGRSWSCSGSYGDSSQNACTLQISFCGDGTTQNTEQCDDNNVTNNDGCSNTCQLEIPTCTLGLSPNGGTVPLNTQATWTIPSWASTTLLDRGDASQVVNPSQPINHTYTSNGTYTTILTIKSNLSGAITNTCTGTVSVTPAPINGVCGSTNSGIYYDFNGLGNSLNISSPGLCSAGNPISFSVGSHIRNWTCQGINGGIDATGCVAYESYCRDSILGTGINYASAEQCDDGNNLSNDGCSPLCQFETPSCTLSIAPSTGFIPLTTSISWTLPTRISAQQLDLGAGGASIVNPTSPVSANYLTAANYLTILTIKNTITGSNVTAQCTGFVQAITSPITGQCNTSLSGNYYSGIQILPSTGSLCSTGSLSGLTQTTSGRSWSCEGLYSGVAQNGCLFGIQYCGDAGLQGAFAEQCDDGNNLSNDGCNIICQFENPSCSLSLSPNLGSPPLNTIATRSASSRSTATNINWGDSFSNTNPTNGIAHTYANTGSYVASLLIQSTVSGSTLTGMCTGSVIVNTTPVNGVCGVVHTSTIYDSNNNGDSLNAGSMGLCTLGTVGSFSFNTSTHQWTWLCQGIFGGSNASCNAQEQYCGDLITQSINGERCDGGIGCNSLCQISIPGVCNPSIVNNSYTTGTTPATGSLCSNGLLTGLIIGTTGWAWTCEGLSGGVTQSGCQLFITTGSASTGGFSPGGEYIGSSSSNNSNNNNSSSSSNGNTNGSFGSSDVVSDLGQPTIINQIRRILHIPENTNSNLGDSSFYQPLYIYSPLWSNQNQNNTTNTSTNNSQSNSNQSTQNNTTNNNSASSSSSSNASLYRSLSSVLSYLPRLASSSISFFPTPSTRPFDPQYINNQIEILDLRAYDQSIGMRNNTSNSNTSKPDTSPIDIVPVAQNENGNLDTTNTNTAGDTNSNNNVSNNSNNQTILSYNSFEKFDIDVASLRYVYTCQKKQYLTSTLEQCIKDLPRGECGVFSKKDNVVTLNQNKVESCIPEFALFKDTIPSVKGALYIEGWNSETEHTIEFLQQFIPSLTIRGKDVFAPYLPGIARIEFDESIPNKYMFALLKHLGIKDQKELEQNPGLVWLAQSYEPEEGKEQEASGKDQELLTYNDPLLSRQTYLQTILYPDALDACTRNGNKKVSVAIVDSAFDTSHEDFGSNIIAKKDIANKDDDVNPPFGKDTDMERAHGTYSAGIIGASSNNGLGVMSIGSDAVKISLYKAAKDGGAGSDIGYGAESLVAAAKTEDQIISLSWGAYISNPKSLSYLQKIVDKIHKQGTLIIASAGNYNKSEPFYPAAFENVIAVGAVDNSLNKASFSNYGDRVDIAAPGVGIMTTSLGNMYESIDGTSEAAPLVAGAAAWILSKGGTWKDIENNLTPIVADVGKGVINLQKVCKVLATKYDPDANDQHYAPSEPTQGPEEETTFKTQESNGSTIAKALMGLLLLLLLLLIGFMRKSMRKQPTQ